jgi:GYF domain 2
MADLWFFGRGSDIDGPVSGSELSQLAATGKVLPTDTIWQDGNEDGIPAAQVPNLFRPAVAAAPRLSVPKTGRAVAGKGVVIIGQDGTTVKYRLKCTTCGQEDASWKSIPIPRGMARAGFFCPKCRKRRDGEIHGYQ